MRPSKRARRNQLKAKQSAKQPALLNNHERKVREGLTPISSHLAAYGIDVKRGIDQIVRMCPKLLHVGLLEKDADSQRRHEEVVRSEYPDPLTSADVMQDWRACTEVNVHSRLETIALHEAAHALVSVLLGVVPQRVQLWPIPLCVDESERGFNWTSAVICIAGPVADQIAMQRFVSDDFVHYAEQTDIDDYQSTYASISAHVDPSRVTLVDAKKQLFRVDILPEDQLELWLRKAESEAEFLLMQNLDAWRAIAAALLDRLQVHRSEILAIVAKHTSAKESA